MKKWFARVTLVLLLTGFLLLCFFIGVLDDIAILLGVIVAIILSIVGLYWLFTTAFDID